MRQIYNYLIKDGTLGRIGDAATLKDVTLRMIRTLCSRKKEPSKSHIQHNQKKIIIRNPTQRQLMHDIEFVGLLSLSRDEFKVAIRKLFSGKKRSKVISNAFTLYDKQHRVCR